MIARRIRDVTKKKTVLEKSNFPVYAGSDVERMNTSTMKSEIDDDESLRNETTAAESPERIKSQKSLNGLKPEEEKMPRDESTRDTTRFRPDLMEMKRRALTSPLEQFLRNNNNFDPLRKLDKQEVETLVSNALLTTNASALGEGG